MLLMAENQDERTIWVVVELHRPKGRIRSRIVLHLGEYRDRAEAEAAFAERLTTNPSLREYAERWAVNARDVLSDRKARARFLMYGVVTGIAGYADDILRRREEEEQQARARAARHSGRRAVRSPRSPRSAFPVPPRSTRSRRPIAGGRFNCIPIEEATTRRWSGSMPRMRRPPSTPPGAADVHSHRITVMAMARRRVRETPLDAFDFSA